ncbi:MAG: peptidylprolyl isomerase [Candidatus Woesearchaeota archaeon]
MKKILAVLSVSLILLSGCGEKNNDNSKVLRVIGNDKITEADIQKELNNIPPQYRAMYDNENGKKQILDRLTEQKILKNVALKQNLQNDKDFKRDLEITKERILANYAVKRNVIDKAKATDEEIKKEYEKEKENFRQKEQVKASHILIRVYNNMTKEEKEKAQQKAKKILEDAIAGKDFAQLAKENSEDGTAQNGGELGWFEKGRMVPEFENACFTGEVGKVYPKLVQTQFGYHIIKIEDKKPEGYKTLDEVKESLKNDIENRKAMEKYNVWMEELKKEYKVNK